MVICPRLVGFGLSYQSVTNRGVDWTFTRYTSCHSCSTLKLNVASAPTACSSLNANASSAAEAWQKLECRRHHDSATPISIYYIHQLWMLRNQHVISYEQTLWPPILNTPRWMVSTFGLVCPRHKLATFCAHVVCTRRDVTASFPRYSPAQYSRRAVSGYIQTSHSASRRTQTHLSKAFAVLRVATDARSASPPLHHAQPGWKENSITGSLQSPRL